MGVHGGFPELLGVHFAQAFVALFADAAFDFVLQPGHGFGEVGDAASLFAALDEGAGAEQAAEEVGGFLELGVVAGDQEVGVDDADLEVAVVHALEAELPAFAGVVVTRDEDDAVAFVLADDGSDGVRAGAGGSFAAEVEAEVVAQDGVQDVAVDEVGEAVDDGFGQ